MLDVIRGILVRAIREQDANFTKLIISDLARARPGPFRKEVFMVAIERCRLLPTVSWIDLNRIAPWGRA